MGPLGLDPIHLWAQSEPYNWHRLWEVAKWCTVLGASDTMCMARAPIKGQILANLVVGLAGP